LQLVHEGHTGAAQVNGVVNAVDLTRHTVNLSHGSIRSLGWPAMTMDFPVGSDVDLATLKPGMQVDFTLVRGTSGMVVDSIRPSSTGR
jgi:Cu/Ag efflux protein CusF